jgi:hypothetical protein
MALSSLLNGITMLRYNFPPTQMLWRQPAIFSPDFILVPPVLISPLITLISFR